MENQENKKQNGFWETAGFVAVCFFAVVGAIVIFNGVSDYIVSRLAAIPTGGVVTQSLMQRVPIATPVVNKSKDETPPKPTPKLVEASASTTTVDTGLLEWIPYESEGGIPYEGTTWSADVAPDEIEVLTGGPACIAGICLPGGAERGSIIIMLPGKEVVHYEVTGLDPGSNWHGSYRPVADPLSEDVWLSLAVDRMSAMQKAPNCALGKGCKIVDVLVVSPGGVVVAQWVTGE